MPQPKQIPNKRKNIQESSRKSVDFVILQILVKHIWLKIFECNMIKKSCNIHKAMANEKLNKITKTCRHQAVPFEFSDYNLFYCFT